MIELPEPSVPTFTCGRCSAELPFTDAKEHRCQLSPKAAEKRTRWLRRRAAEKAAEQAPRRCPDCRQMMAVGVAHRCPGHPPVLDDADRSGAIFQAEGIVSVLRRAGYVIEKKPDA